MSPGTPHAGRRKLSGSALVAVAALGPLLIGSVLYSHHAVRQATDTVLRGEADAWIRVLFGRLRDVEPTGELLAALLAEGKDEGLRYVAVVDHRGRFEAGRPSAPLEEGGAELAPLTRHGDLTRVVFRGPPRRFGGPPPARRDGPPRPRGMLVVEFEPRASAALTRTSRQTLAVGTVTALAVVALSLLMAQANRRRLAVEREAARARHLAALGEMSAVLAHEIRNPLASLKGHAQLLVEGLAGAGQEKPRAKAERVVQEAVRLEGITNDLLDYVRQGELARAPADLLELVRQSVEEVVPADRLVLTGPPAPLHVAVDAGKVRQVIENVARNAVQVSEGLVEITVAATAGEASVVVRDHGPGVPPGQEERIFEPFVTTRVRGTGLGLAVARRIAERHGGTLTAANHPQGGALFRLTLPR